MRLNLFVAALATLAFAFALPAGQAVAQLTAPLGTVVSPPAKPKELSVHELYVDSGSGEVMMVREIGDAAVSLQLDLAGLCEAASGSHGKIPFGVDYVKIEIKGGKVHAGGNSAKWACPLDTNALPSGWPGFLTDDWPRLADANGSGHYTPAHAKSVADALRDDCLDGFIVIQNLKRRYGADLPFFKAGGLDPTMNRVHGCIVDTGVHEYLIWEDMDDNPQAHHAHEYVAATAPLGGPRVTGLGGSASLATTAPALAGGGLTTSTAGGGLRTN